MQILGGFLVGRFEVLAVAAPGSVEFNDLDRSVARLATGGRSPLDRRNAAVMVERHTDV